MYNNNRYSLRKSRECIHTYTQMLSVEKRKILFLLACMPIRIIIAVIPLYIDKSLIPLYGGLLSLLMIGFFYLYFNKLRMHAAESGGETWRSVFRVLDAVLYLCATIYAFQGKRIAWVPLAIDLVIGLVLFLNNHFG